MEKGGHIGIASRKTDHLELCATTRVDFHRKSTLFEEVELIHHALPELQLHEVELQTNLLGKVLRAPLVVSAMTGGTPQAAVINRTLASVAEKLGLGFGLGSQRAMLVSSSLTETYAVREVAPSTLLMGNIGLVQARDTTTADLQAMCRNLSLDALCVHLNPAMEVIQAEGDRDFRGGIETLQRLVAELGIPIVVKETGSGISHAVALQLRGIGITTVDVSGAGGTSWVGVETLRAAESSSHLGQIFWDWGIPTAVSVSWAKKAGLEVIATGGLRSGLDVAKALSLGATVGGTAAPVLRAYLAGGVEAVEILLSQWIDQLRVAAFLSGCASTAELQQAPRVLGPLLRGWLAQAI